jgi:PII-like signaling protein
LFIANGIMDPWEPAWSTSCQPGPVCSHRVMLVRFVILSGPTRLGQRRISTHRAGVLPVQDAVVNRARSFGLRGASVLRMTDSRSFVILSGPTRLDQRRISTHRAGVLPGQDTIVNQARSFGLRGASVLRVTDGQGDRRSGCQAVRMTGAQVCHPERPNPVGTANDLDPPYRGFDRSGCHCQPGEILRPSRSLSSQDDKRSGCQAVRMTDARSFVILSGPTRLGQRRISTHRAGVLPGQDTIVNQARSFGLRGASVLRMTDGQGDRRSG